MTLQIAGTEGHAVIFNDALYFESKQAAGSKISTQWTSLPEAPKAPLHQFVDAVRGAAGQPLVTPREAAERVVVMEALYAAGRGGGWTTVA